MKHLQTLALLLLSLSTYAQVPYDLATDFAPIGATWTHHRYGGYPNCGGQQSMVCIKDTLFRGRNAKVFLSNIGGGQKEWILASDSDRIYHYAPELDSFYVLYDFSLQAGDTLWIRKDTFPGYYNNGFLGRSDTVKGFAVVIDSTDTVVINGSIRRRQFTHSILSWFSAWTYAFSSDYYPNIEGIGSTHLFFGLPSIVSIGSCLGEFCSYVDSSTSLVLDDCSPSSSRTPNMAPPDWKLVYQPDQQLIQVQFTHVLVTEIEISLFDIHGKLWQKTSLPPGHQQTEFSIPSLATGVYLIRLTRKGEPIASRKVLFR